MRRIKVAGWAYTPCRQAPQHLKKCKIIFARALKHGQQGDVTSRAYSNDEGVGEMIRDNKASIILLGIFLILVLFLTTGADSMRPQETGRYRMSVAIRGNFTDIYVIDTETGVVKYLGKDEGKPFDQVSGK
jgi:hypothetical protein